MMVDIRGVSKLRYAAMGGGCSQIWPLLKYMANGLQRLAFRSTIIGSRRDSYGRGTEYGVVWWQKQQLVVAATRPCFLVH